MENQTNGVLTTGQKAVIAYDLAVREGISPAEAAARVGSSERAVERVRGVFSRRPDLREQLANGSLPLNKALVEAGYVTTRSGIALGRAFGKGDKWLEATEPLMRYLAQWRIKNFAFTHLNPREAFKRIERIDEMIEMLEAAKTDLEHRSHRAQLSVSNRRESR